MAYYGIQWLPKVLAFNIYENERDKYMYMHYRLHYQAKVHRKIKEIKPLTNTKNIKYYAIKSLNEHFIIYLVFGGKRDLYNIFNSSYREVLMYLTAFHFFQPTCRTQSESGSQSFTNGKQIIWFSGRNSLTSSSKATKIGFSRAVLRRQRLN